MTTEDLPGGSAPGTAHPAGVVPQPRVVRHDEVAGLRQPEFPIVLRGYDREVVDAYVERVNEVIAAIEAGSSPQAAVRHALDQVSEETRGILERAHETADEIAARSRAQAEERLESAEREAREAIAAAETRVRMLDSDADEVWRERRKLIADVKRVAAELAELADSASRRFPPEAEEETEEIAAAEPPPPPPPPPRSESEPAA